MRAATDLLLVLLFSEVPGVKVPLMGMAGAKIVSLFHVKASSCAVTQSPSLQVLTIFCTDERLELVLATIPNA